MKRIAQIVSCAAILAFGSLALAQPAPGGTPGAGAPPAFVPFAKGKLAIVGGELWQPDAEPLPDSVIVIEDGLVRYAGADHAQAAGLELIDARGKIVTAGFVDVLTQVGLLEVDLEESTRDTSAKDPDPIRAAFRAADAYNPASVVVPVARREGLTSVGVVPTGGLVAGQSAWADLEGERAPAALANTSLALHVFIDDAAQEGAAESHNTSVLRLRELFDDARLYRQKRQNYEENRLRTLGTSRLDLETVSRALEGKLPVVFHVDRASDIVVVLGLAAEYGLTTVLASAAEGWKVARDIAAAKVPVIVYPLDHGPRSFAALGAREDNAALLAQAGVSVVLSTGSSHNARKLRQEAGNAVRAGLPRKSALAAVTANAARAFGLGDRYGTLAAGRVGNAVVWSGDPFELSSAALTVVIRGKVTSLLTRQSALLERYR